MKYNKAMQGAMQGLLSAQGAIPIFAHELLMGLAYLNEGWERCQGAQTGGAKRQALDFEFTEVVWKRKGTP